MPAATVQRQIVLPLSKAFAIAAKGLKLRLGRSLLVTTGIILALAFLSFIQVNDAMIEGMRLWIQQAGADASNAGPLARQFAQDRQQQIQLRQTLEQHAQTLAALSHNKIDKKAAFDPTEKLGADWDTLQQELGALPVATDVLGPLVAQNADAMAALQRWIAARRELLKVQQSLAGPQILQAKMHTHGVPTEPAAIANSRSQSHWLTGLSLLVAFAGILNAMLMSVTERFREIGTMKCLGALDSFIIKLFVIESMLQGVVGTVLGVAIGLALSLGSISYTYGGYAWKEVLWPRILLSLAACLALGIILTVAAAVYPAWRGARMQPIEAMRADT